MSRRRGTISTFVSIRHFLQGDEKVLNEAFSGRKDERAALKNKSGQVSYASVSEPIDRSLTLTGSHSIDQRAAGRSEESSQCSAPYQRHKEEATRRAANALRPDGQGVRRSGSDRGRRIGNGSGTKNELLGISLVRTAVLLATSAT